MPPPRPGRRKLRMLRIGDPPGDTTLVVRAVGISWKRRRRRNQDLRHTSVALTIAAAAHPKASQSRMGHSSINVTLDGYGSLFRQLDEAIAVGFGERLAAVRRLRSAS